MSNNMFYNKKEVTEGMLVDKTSKKMTNLCSMINGPKKICYVSEKNRPLDVVQHVASSATHRYTPVRQILEIN